MKAETALKLSAALVEPTPAVEFQTPAPSPTALAVDARPLTARQHPPAKIKPSALNPLQQLDVLAETAPESPQPPAHPTPTVSPQPPARSQTALKADAAHLTARLHQLARILGLVMQAAMCLVAEGTDASLTTALSALITPAAPRLMCA